MRNIANKTDGVGDTLTASDFNSFNEELENAVLSTDQSLDVAGGPDTNLNMLGNAIAAYANAGSTYQDSGSANSYILAISSNLNSVTKYYDRMSVRFKPGSSNTGPSTVNVNNLGVKNIVDEVGVALVANTIIINRYITLTYILSSDKFELLSGDVTQTGTETLTNKTFESPVINIGVSGSAMSDSTPEKSSESGSSGSASTISRKDHKHPIDASDSTPEKSSESGSPGSSIKFSRGDHKHPSHQQIIWRMLNNESGGSHVPLGGGGSDWEISDDVTLEKPLGSGAVTESFGIFSFASTGYWAIRFYGISSNSSSIGSCIFNALITDNNFSSTQTVATSINTHKSTGETQSLSGEVLLKISNISNNKIKFQQSATGDIKFQGTSSANQTYIVFEKKSDL